MSVQSIPVVDSRYVTQFEVEEHNLFSKENKEISERVNKFFEELIADPEIRRESVRNRLYGSNEIKIMSKKWDLNFQNGRLLPSSELETQLAMLKDSNPFKDKLQINNPFISDVDEFRKKGKPYSNVYFSLQDETKLWANSGILCMKSPVFEAFFANWHKADEQGIEIKEYSEKVFDGMLSVLHGKPIDPAKWSIEEIIDLAKCSEFYQISDLTETCYSLLWENIDVENCFSVLEFAVQLSKAGSKEISERFLAHCKLFINSSKKLEETLNLEESEMKDLLHLISLLSHPMINNNWLRKEIVFAVQNKLSVDNFSAVCNKSAEVNYKPLRKIVHEFAKKDDHLEFIKKDQEATEAWKKHQLYF
jgi:BTB/POZ domain